MRIAFRTGGGRGAYELAGSQGSYPASALFNREMFYELTPELVIPGYAVPASRSGKPRIKLDEDRRRDADAVHLCYLLAALLLLPEPRRDPKAADGSLLLAYKAYSMTIIKIDVVRIDSDKSLVRPTEMLLQNAQGRSESMDFIARMSRIMAVWSAADDSDSELAELLRQHKAVFSIPNISHGAIQQAAESIREYIGGGGDPLPAVELQTGIEQSLKSEELTPVVQAKGFGIEDVVPSEVAQIESVRTWRRVAARSPAAQRFSTAVKECYRQTCLFTGQRLPKLESTHEPGVDAAHILPWATHGINSVSNGICLTKQSHWAFDAGVVKLSFDRTSNQYVITIPDIVSIEATEASFSLNAYQAMVGAIPPERLPNNPNLRPNPNYIDAYNEIMFSTH
jgi:HNH endonuclease